MSDTGPKPEQKSEEEIINFIIASMERHDQMNEDGTINCTTLQLKYGSKLLKISYNPEFEYAPDEIIVGFYIKNIKPENSKLPNETTMLYKAAKKILQNIADEYKKDVIYTMITQEKKLINWAKTTGEQIFRWDKTKDQDETNFTATKLFHPKNQSEIKNP